jgi:hypothetical protein
MATTYAEFTSTPATLVADLRAAILASSDWAQPNAGGAPNLVAATTTRGVQMAVDLSDVTPTTQVAVFGVYRSHNGTVGVDKVQKRLWFKRVASGAVDTVTLTVTVSAGKEHIYVSIEGPRPGVNFADNASFGSLRAAFFISDLIPYFPVEDTVPVAVCGANHLGAGFDQTLDPYVYTYSATQGYRQSKLLTLREASLSYGGPNRNGRDGDLYLSPYVVSEDSMGMRGRLNKFFYCGLNFYDAADAPVAPQNSRVVYDTLPLKILAPYKSDAANIINVAGPFGYIVNANGVNQYTRSPLVAVPTV